MKTYTTPQKVYWHLGNFRKIDDIHAEAQMLVVVRKEKVATDVMVVTNEPLHQCITDGSMTTSGTATNSDGTTGDMDALAITLNPDGFAQIELDLDGMMGFDSDRFSFRIAGKPTGHPIIQGMHFRGCTITQKSFKA